MAAPSYSVDIDHEPVTTVFSRGDIPVVDHKLDADEEILVALGYRQDFKRKFTIWSSFSVSFSVLGLLPSVAATLAFSLGYAGTAGMVWGWLIASVMIQFVAFSMAELCSSMPTAGGLYYASAVLAPEGWGPLAAWITGWSNFLGQVTGPASVDYSCAAMMLAAGAIGNPDYVPQQWHTYLLTVCLLIIQAMIASLHTRFLARFNQVGTIINLTALVVFLIVAPAASINSPKTNKSSDVWGTLTNGTVWPDGFAVLMSFLGVIWTMSGYDAPFHLSEECSNANIASPRAIVMTSTLGGILGWFVMLVIGYTVQDVASVVGSDLGQPMGSYLLQVLGAKGGLGIFSLVIISCFFMGQGCMVASSRVIYAYSRDGALPGSRIWEKVHPWTRTPVYAVWFDCLIGCLLNLLIFGGPVAIGAIFSIGAIAQYIAFILPVAIRVIFVRDNFRAGPWNLGKFSRPCGFIALGWVCLIAPVLCFPAVNDPTPMLMNWTCLVYGGPMFMALVWYAVDARKWFKGPKVNVEHRMINRPVPTDAVPLQNETDSPASGSFHEKEVKNGTSTGITHQPTQ